MTLPVLSGLSARVLVAVGLCLLAGGCATSLTAEIPADPMRYRLAHSGDHWDVVDGDRVVEDVTGRYAEFFDVILDPRTTHMPNAILLRDDLERAPVDRRNYDALNAVAIAYFETNYRAESGRGEGLAYISLSTRSAKLVALPWRAYSEIEDPALRDAILDFFDDAGSGEKLGSAATASRLARVVHSLGPKEPDPERHARIQTLVIDLERRWLPESQWH